MTKKAKEILEEIEQLDGAVLSIYLNTNPRSEDWKIRLKNGLKKTEEYIAASNPETVNQFSKISKNVQGVVIDNQRKLTNSFVCFATANKVLKYPLQIPVENDFQWGEKPALDQLNSLFEKYSRTGVILLQRSTVTLITSSLGELVSEVSFELDLDTESWKRYKGVAFGSLISSSASHEHKFERRLKEHQTRFYREIVPTIQKYAKSENWNGVHLAGPAELTKMMRELLNLNIIGETTRNYSGKSAHTVLERTILATD